MWVELNKPEKLAVAKFHDAAWTPLVSSVSGEDNKKAARVKLKKDLKEQLQEREHARQVSIC